MLAGLAMAPDNLYMAPYLGHSFAPAATWNLHTTQTKYFAPTSSCKGILPLTFILINNDKQASDDLMCLASFIYKF
jgi:hypothetical protein